MGQYGDIKLYSGNGNLPLAEGVANYLGMELCGRQIIEFPNENLFVKLDRSVRGQDCYAIQSTSRPVNRNLMELLILLQTLYLDFAARLTAVVPYMCYARSDKKDQPRVPITARLVADMIEVAGTDRYILMNLHAGQIQGFFKIPGDVLTAYHMLTDDMKQKIAMKKVKDPVVVSADLGFAKQARNIAEELGIPLAFIEKRRSGNDANAKALSVIGDVAGRDCFLCDDEVDTAGSMSNDINLLIENGATSVHTYFVHPVFSGPAVDRLTSTKATQFTTTDSIEIPEKDFKRFNGRLNIISVSSLLGEVISRVNRSVSVGSLFRE
ncbi:MAG: ribose-phosphate diphosphokinase [Anaerolineaceae bacterium]|nr:ribose-phosphate diphosphokinase [Anaerolineaceae bacterium]